MSRLGHRAWKLYMSSSCQKLEPEHSEPRGTKRKRNQQELQLERQLERQDDNAHAYTSLESTMPVQSTKMGDNIGIDSDMDDDPSPMIEQV